MTCWCGAEHPPPDQRKDLPLADAATALGHDILAALFIPGAVEWLDRQLRRWPWLYARLSR